MRVYNTPALSYDDLLIAPDYSEVPSRADVDLSTYVTKNVKLDIPLVSAPMDTVTGPEMCNALGAMGGMGFLHRYCSLEEQVAMAKAVDAGITFGAAVGIRGDYLERAMELEANGASVILLDVAHADHKDVVEALQELKRYVEVDILVGNVATPEATGRLIMNGADGIRVGIGSGSHCTTRLQAGVGVPQASAVDACYQVTEQEGVPLCADGGIVFPGDAAKAIGLGAHTFMSGTILAGTNQTPGPVSIHGYGTTEKRFKEYRGMASYNAKQSDNRPTEHLEGVSTLVPYRGDVQNIVSSFMDGIRSAMSYVGAQTIDEFHKKCIFLMVTPNANHLHKRNGM